MAPTKVWRGQTLRDRTADRRTALLDVGCKLLGSGGSAAVTMRAVCRDAQLSPRYFYESFDGREDLLVAVYNQVEERLLAHLMGRRTDQPVTLREVLESCADFFEEDPQRARILLREPLADDTLRKHSASRTPAFVAALIPVLGPQLNDLLAGDVARIQILSTALGGALVALYLDWADGRLNVSRDTIADAAVDIVMAMTGFRAS
ncbi:TetR/AcrR family transcriptional regulator [Mycolicibacterium diernhoferi]|uniref:TetR family transcriptional regulator n=1 Tax=Mycolicibacterium diernhoferi TaxID=1801 RepID=A0A1Q4HHG9_9MYCO|nr:TetR/AcrR family transcriptional regulator [Mycolicibacterium diernhoferi]OJZ66947.1 TetR family transcriptional regulator [Mycolicibacterium diernhoferi]OPE54606.1 TetR family transcriptional regulator [Mycolicibacterium diernhoferi]QYL23137.1 TetR/AcrR family transcriptional regulator [Mycolicibacterium diernhoferi]